MRSSLVQGGDTGSSLPSRNSSEAPPPVDTWVIRSVESRLGDGRRRIAATDDRDRAAIGRLRHRVSDCQRAAVERWRLEHAHRPVPQDGACRRSAPQNSRSVAWSMSYTAHPWRNRVPRHGPGLRVALELLRHDRPAGEHDLVAAFTMSAAPDRSVGLDQRGAGLEPHRPEEACRPSRRR